MLEKITSAPKKVKNHVVKHRTKYAIVATAAVAYGLQMHTADKFNTFLESKDLLEEYYFLDEV
jgi:hypothetical protein